MVVTRRKSANRIGRTSGPTKTNQAAQTKMKGSSNIPQTHALETVGENLDKSNRSDLADSRTEITCVAAAQNPQQILEMENKCVMEECKDISNKDS